MPAAPLWAYSEENLSFICSSEKPAGFSELLFHRKGRNFQMLLFFAAPSVKMGLLQNKNVIATYTNK